MHAAVRRLYPLRCPNRSFVRPGEFPSRVRTSAAHDSSPEQRVQIRGRYAAIGRLYFGLDGMQVFISYAHTPADTELARYLAARLRDAGIGAWLDEASLAGGSRLQADIESAIAASNAGVFLVSPSWLASEWTAFELEQFKKLDAEVIRRIPVFRVARERMVIPPALTAMTGVVWLPDDVDNDARFWQVHCALTAHEPGPMEEWSLRGRTITASAAAIPPPRRMTPLASGRPSLRCDRAVQWKTVDDLA